MTQTPSLPTAPYEQRPYRPCVGIFLLNNDGLVFAGRRIDSRAEAWQMPQGGIDAGESPLQACMREMREEIGTNTAELVSQHDDWLYYDIPLPLADRLWQGRYKGKSRNGWRCALPAMMPISTLPPKNLNSANGNGYRRMILSIWLCRLSAMFIKMYWQLSRPI